MRVVLRSRNDADTAGTVVDMTYSYSDASKTRAHWDLISSTLRSVLMSEMESVYDNTAHNYLDVLVTRKTA